MIALHFCKRTVQFFDCFCCKNDKAMMHAMKWDIKSSHDNIKSKRRQASSWRCFLNVSKKKKMIFFLFVKKIRRTDCSIFLIVHAESRCKFFFGTTNRDRKPLQGVLWKCKKRRKPLHCTALHRTVPHSAVRCNCQKKQEGVLALAPVPVPAQAQAPVLVPVTMQRLSSNRQH